MTQQNIELKPMYRTLYDIIVTRNPSKPQLISMVKDYIPVSTVHVYVGMLIRSGFIYSSPHTGQMYRTIRPESELTSAAMQEVKVATSHGDFMMTQANKDSANVATTTPVVQATTQSTTVSVPPRTISQKMVNEGARPVTLDALYTLNIGDQEVSLNQSELRLLKQQLDNLVNI